MKKNKTALFIVLLCISIGIVTTYFAYGNTLIDITNEKSIGEKLSVNPKEPITILATKKSTDYFAVIYTDPTDEDKSLYHFRYLTKVPFYKNCYQNIGGYSAFTTGVLNLVEANISDDKRKTAEVFIYRVGKTVENNSKCSVFKSNLDENYINYEEITNEEQIIDKIQRQADSYKKLDEFEVPHKSAFIITKTYPIDNPSDSLEVIDDSVSNNERKQIIIDSVNDIIKEYKETQDIEKDNF